MPDDWTPSREAIAGLLALSPAKRVVTLIESLPIIGQWDRLRGPESGLIMLRGRMGGGGDPFNLGEATVARASIALPDGRKGHGYVLGRDTRHAEMIAVVDALVQAQDDRDLVMERVVAPLRQERSETLAADSAAADKTKVDFFTMVRGSVPK
ncbi:MAG: phosphonate C-P lyase system protein PhnG [Pseudomonadota bacterium]